MYNGKQRMNHGGFCASTSAGSVEFRGAFIATNSRTKATSLGLASKSRVKRNTCTLKSTSQKTSCFFCTKSSNSHHLSISLEETVLVPASADSAAHARAHIPFCRSVTCQVCSQHLRQWSNFHLIFFQKHVSDPSEKNCIGILADKTHQKATFSILPSCSVFQTA